VKSTSLLYKFILLVTRYTCRIKVLTTIPVLIQYQIFLKSILYNFLSINNFSSVKKNYQSHPTNITRKKLFRDQYLATKWNDC